MSPSENSCNAACVLFQDVVAVRNVGIRWDTDAFWDALEAFDGGGGVIGAHFANFCGPDFVRLSLLPVRGVEGE